MNALRTIIVAVVLAAGTATASAQLGSLINKARRTVDNAKNVAKEVKDVKKKIDGDVEFRLGSNRKGVYRARTRQYIFDQLHEQGPLAGKHVVYTIQDNGDVTFDDGRKVGTIYQNGQIHKGDRAPYVTLLSNGTVEMDGEAIGRVDDQGNVSCLGEYFGSAPGMDKLAAAYLYFAIYLDYDDIVRIKKEKAEAAARRKAQQEEARRQAATASAQKATQKTAPQRSSTSQKAAPQQKVQEWTVEKGSARGYVDANGVVYNWSHTKLGQLPKGNGNITDASGMTIGSIWSGDIKDRSGRLVAHVTSGGSISVEGSNATVAEVHAAGRIDWSKDSRTIGRCDVRPYEWAVALVFCDFFNF